MLDTHLGLADLRGAKIEWHLDHMVGVRREISWKNFLTGSKVTKTQFEKIACSPAEKEGFFLTIMDDDTEEVLTLGAESWDKHHGRAT
jgi:hypothetical protein